MLNLASEVLGGGKNSRLYQALIYNNQLATSVNVGINVLELASMFEITVDLKAGADEKKVEALINAELEKFFAEGPTDDELKRAKTSILSNRIRGLEQIGGFGG